MLRAILLIVRKDPQGNVLVAQSSDLDFEEATALGSYFGALAGLVEGGAEGMERGAIAGAADMADGHIFDENDVFRVTQALNPSTTAVLVLIEHKWARDLFSAVEDAGGLELMNEWLRPESILGGGGAGELEAAPDPERDEHETDA